MLDVGSTEDAGKQSWHYWPEILENTQQKNRSIVVVTKKSLGAISQVSAAYLPQTL
jgi:hypothetical protein